MIHSTTLPNDSSHPTRFDDRTAFTLTELLTVIAIIGILAAILVPVVGRARASAHLVECTANLKALHQGFTLYAADNKRTYPAVTGNAIPGMSTTGSWMLALQQGGYLSNKDQALQAGVQNVFRCPDAEATYANGARRTYTMNSLLKGQAFAIVVNQLAEPARSLLLIDGNDSGSQGDAWLSLTETSYTTRIDYRHSGSANTLFADGHVELVKPNDPSLLQYVKNINP